MFNRPLLSVILLILPLFSCSKPAPSSPACRLQSALTIDSSSKAAGCIIPINEKLLLIEHRLSGGLDIPGGTRNEGESLACTAHRETWEETGLNVTVGNFLTSTTNGMALFSCYQDAGFEALPDNIEAPTWAKLEVKSLRKVRPFELDDDALRFKQDLLPILDGFVAAQRTTKAAKEIDNITRTR